jgi:hypothetical protein
MGTLPGTEPFGVHCQPLKTLIQALPPTPEQFADFLLFLNEAKLKEERETGGRELELAE